MTGSTYSGLVVEATFERPINKNLSVFQHRQHGPCAHVRPKYNGPQVHMRPKLMWAHCLH